MNTTKKWGVYLLGHPFDLQDWADVLKQFDPWVVQDGKEFVLRWSGFDGFETASDVQKRAGFLVELLNGAMWIDRGTRPVRFDAGGGRNWLSALTCQSQYLARYICHQAISGL
jgi:hypothetical protein